MFGIKAEDGNVHLCGSPLYHTAVLVFASTSLHFGHAVVLMDQWTPEACLEAIQKYRVTTSHMVPTQFHRLLALPEEVRERYDVSSMRCMVHAAAPCPVEVKQPHDRVVGSCDLRVLRRDRGRRHAGRRRGVDEEARHRRPRLGRRRDPIFDDDGQRAARPARSAPST